MRMPGINGAEMLSEINKLDSDIVNILITGQSDFEVAKEAVNSGKVFKILTKPCSSEELVKTLKEASLAYQKKVVENVSRSENDGKIHLLTVWPPTSRMSRWYMLFPVENLYGIWGILKK